MAFSSISRLHLSWCVVALSIISFYKVECIAVMSVDLGVEWMKVAIVSPGVPMEIALNKDSQRKTPVAIAFRDGERHFGEQAVSTGVRFPDKSYSHFLDLLGKDRNSPVVKEFERRFPYYQLEADPKTGGVLFRHPEGMTFSPEELLGMILAYAREFASNAAGQTIKDAVITVPAFFNQAERRALAQAASLGGLKLLQLIGANTAAALNYGVFRRKEFNDTPVHILFYDMGTGSTTATIVAYQTVKTKDKILAEHVPQLSIKGVGYDRFLGGLEFKLRLGQRFAREFSALKKTKQDVFDNKRGLAKLFKEADRVKKVLSANTEHIAQVENVMEDVDFKHPITRAEFEEISDDLFKRVAAPIHMALSSAGMTLGEIDQVIVVGGSTRIPRVQQELHTALGSSRELGKSVNADEAAALGAAYQAAYLSKGFKVKLFQVKEASLFPIQVDFSRDVDTDGVKSTKVVRRVLFNRNNLYPQKKVMTFSRYTSDFDFDINYGDLSFLSSDELSNFGSLNISKVSLTGVAEAIQKHATDAEPKGIKAHFRLDESGLLHLDSVSYLFDKKVPIPGAKQKVIKKDPPAPKPAEATFEKTVEEVVPPAEESTLSRLGSTLGKLFSGSADEPTKEESGQEADNNTAQAQDNTTASHDSENRTQAEQRSSEGEAAGNETTKTTKLVTVKEPVTIRLTLVDRTEFTAEQLAESVKKLSDLDSKDRAKLARDHARNALESFLHETKDKMYSDEYEKASTEEERQNIIAKLTEGSDWLEYESDSAETKTFKEKLSGLTRLVKDLFDRVQEHRERPGALVALNNMLNASEVYLSAITGLQDQVFTPVEIETLSRIINETKDWQAEQVTIQAQTPLHEAPKMTLRMIFEKIQLLDRETKYLLNKAQRAPPPKPTTKKPETPEPAKEAEEEVVADVEMPEGPVPVEQPATEGEGAVPFEPVEPTPEQPEDGQHTEL
ncbi:hypoxia up-regulated protein 1 isoform X1 [Dermacentor silvarum]|uniref:hypoxia up-regulated protein 1 isoform X1 n=1 Tax=Dermacentor silvarum TaxID=543639 RepID=UPI001898481F|nr:hypoxia up-regulated protein 1 isoform X1 [Dermacentor silvarum]